METFQHVFIATPTHICKRYCAGQFSEAILAYAQGAKVCIINNSKARVAQFYKRDGDQRIDCCDIALGESCYGQEDSIHRRIVESMNLARQLFLKSGCSHFLSLEADVLLTPATLPKLLARDVPVVSANCYPGFHQETEFSRVGRLTMGCTLVQRNVLKKIEFRYDPGLLAAHYDAFFVFDCLAAGIEVYHDPEIECEHMLDMSGTRGWQQLPMSERQR